MIRCILGERNSGKSVYAENLVKDHGGNALYVATLPKIDIYKEKIRIHKERRPSDWDWIELFEMPSENIFVYPYHKYENILLDNLSFYVLYQISANPEELLAAFDEWFVPLLDQLEASGYSTLYIIDTPVRPGCFRNEWESEIFQQFFFQILRKADSIERFHKGCPADSLSREEAVNYLFHSI